ncbi:MAG: hypothetical protein ABI134_14775 [Byssovorax sp.]
MSLEWEITADITGAARAGLVLRVTGARRPAWRWEAARNRLRLVVGDEPRLWARSDLSWWDPPWFAHRADGPLPPVIPPILASDLRAIRHTPRGEGWWRTWALRFAEALGASACSPLHEGTWRLARLDTGSIERAMAWGYLPGQGVPFAHSVGTMHSGWGVWRSVHERSGQGEVVLLRRLEARDVGRIKVWRRRALEGTLPPVVVAYCAPLGLHLVLDGHARLCGAVEAGVEPPLMVLFPVRESRTPWRDESREQALRDAASDLEMLAPLGPAGIDIVNRALIHAFDERVGYTPITRAWPLVGGVERWTRDIEQATAHLRDEATRTLRDEMLELPRPGGSVRSSNRQRVRASTS